MCFAIPKRIISVTHTSAVTEDGLHITTTDIPVTVGDYVVVYGTIAIDKISKEKALSIRKTISSIDRA